MTKTVGRKEFAERMKELVEESKNDEEVAHIEADELMCEVLRSLGYQRGVDYFCEMCKWYA